MGTSGICELSVHIIIVVIIKNAFQPTDSYYSNTPSFEYYVSIFDPDDFCRKATVSSNTTTHTFTGVLKGSYYNVTVLATNVIGDGTLAHTTIGEYSKARVFSRTNSD